MAVYFLQQGESSSYKIGFTAGDPRKRHDALRTGSPEELRLVASLPWAGLADEKAIHNELKSFGLGLRAEWFTLDPVSTRKVVGRICRQEMARRAHAELQRFLLHGDDEEADLQFVWDPTGLQVRVAVSGDEHEYDPEDPDVPTPLLIQHIEDASARSSFGSPVSWDRHDDFRGIQLENFDEYHHRRSHDELVVLKRASAELVDAELSKHGGSSNRGGSPAQRIRKSLAEYLPVGTRAIDPSILGSSSPPRQPYHRRPTVSRLLRCTPTCIATSNTYLATSGVRSPLCRQMPTALFVRPSSFSRRSWFTRPNGQWNFATRRAWVR